MPVGIQNGIHNPFGQSLFRECQTPPRPCVTQEQGVTSAKIRRTGCVLPEGANWTQKSRAPILILRKRRQAKRSVDKISREGLWQKRRVRPQGDPSVARVPSQAVLADRECMQFTDTPRRCNGQKEGGLQGEPGDVRRRQGLKRCAAKGL